MTTLNLNGDMGESFGRYTLGDDAALIKAVKSASIACGFHAGDPNVMARAVKLAKDHGGKTAKIVLDALDYALGQVNPLSLVNNAVKVKGNAIYIKGIKAERFSLRNVDRAYVVGGGKG